MDSERARPARALIVRSVLLGGLIWLSLYFLAALHLYIGALVILGIAVAVVFELRHTIATFGRLQTRDLERILEAGSDSPGIRASGDMGPTGGVEQVLRALALDRSRKHLKIESLQALLDTVATALIILKTTGGVTLVNRAAYNLAGKPIGRLQDIDALGPAAIEMLSTLAPGQRRIFSLADGRSMFVSASGFSSPGHEPERLLALQPISGQLDAVELHAWQNMARVLAHEIMNSLTPIASLSEGLEGLLRKSDETGSGLQIHGLQGELRQSLETISRRSRGLMDFVARYRAIADLPAPRWQVFPVARELQDIGRLLEATCQDKGIRYTSQVEPPDLRVRADPELLARAVLNLLRNSVEALSDTINPSIAVTCREVDGQVTIEVTDNGPGIAEELREEVFVPFFTTRAEGFGIGLSLARQIALAHGGRLELVNGGAGGCVFRLSLA